MRLASAAVILLASWGSALAADMPHFDVAAQCKQVASFGGPYSESTFAGCMEMEQSAYDQLKGTWPNLSASMKSQCSRVASFGGPGSYSTLQGCVEMEQQAATSNQNRQFKY